MTGRGRSDAARCGNGINDSGGRDWAYRLPFFADEFPCGVYGGGNYRGVGIGGQLPWIRNRLHGYSPALGSLPVVVGGVLVFAVGI